MQGKMATGRPTIERLKLNRLGVINLRRVLSSVASIRLTAKAVDGNVSECYCKLTFTTSGGAPAAVKKSAMLAAIDCVSLRMSI